MRLGLFGGTFDPVHNAHLFVAEAARVALRLDRIVFLPARAAHHRAPPVAGIEARMTMLRLAIASNVHFALDESDAQDSATGYTVDLLPRLRARHPDAAFTFIVGADSLVQGPWRRLDSVLAQLEGFAIAPRAERTPERLYALLENLTPAERAKFRLLDLPTLAGSATLVRDQLARGGSIRYLVPEPVYRYIEEHALYGRPTPPA